MPFTRIEHAGGAVDSALSGDISSGVTSIGLTTVTAWPTGGVGPFYVVIDPGLVGEEKILATARSSSTLTGCTRGVDGTAPSAHTAGAVVKHVFVAAEADEANQAAVQTLGNVANKGDLLVGTTTNTLAPLTVGANGLPLVANSGATVGANWALLGTSGIAANAITTALIADANVTGPKIANGSITQAKLASSSIHIATFSIADTGVGDPLIPHGASFTPTAAFVSFFRPSTSPGNVIGGVMVAFDGTNITMRIMVNDGSGTVAALPNHSLLTGCTLVFA